jgi:alkanesulfonate monooxygenase SsuD/methylene tetrahydromethanopterin reductase-like flavin-dependent oxidoreductase (luciferase family)
VNHSDKLRVGVILNDLAVATGREIGDAARFAEELGMEAVFMGDHLVPAVPYPDSVTVLATAAAATERIRVGFGVMVLALRPVAWAAKQVAALQQMSADRVVLGIGSSGEMHGRAAWDAVGVPFDERGRRTDESLALLPGLIAGKPTRVGGAEITIAPSASVPPIWIGGNSTVAIRRAARHGDAWYPSMITPEKVAASARRLAELAAEAGRPTPGVAVGGTVALGPDASSGVDELVRGLHEGYGLPLDEARRVPITGSPQQVADRLAEYAGAGVRHVVLGTAAGDWRRQWELVAQARELL